MKNWILENKMLAGILCFMAVGVLGLGAWLYLCYDTYATAHDDYSRLGAEVTNLESSKLTPNKANVDAKTTKVKDYEERVSKLRDVLLINQQPVKPMAETEFQAKLKERVNTVSQKSKLASMELPANFALSFDDYTASLPKSPEVSAELSLHLDMMEKLATTLVESGVKKLETLERTKLPLERGAPTPPPAPVKPAARPAAKPGAKGKGAAALPEVSAEPVLDRFPIKLTFNCDQAPLQNVLNTLANPNPKTMPYFMVVRLLRIDNEKLDAPTKEEIKNLKQSSSPVPGSEETPVPAKAAAGAARVISAPVAAPPDAATIMGEELLHVYMEVDYIRFRESSKGAAAPETKK